MHPGSPSDPSGTAATEAKPRYVYSILKPHGHSFRRQVRLLLSEAKPSYIYSILKPHSQISRIPVRPLVSWANPIYIFNFKTIWSEFQKPSQTVTRGEAELLILDFKTT